MVALIALPAKLNKLLAMLVEERMRMLDKGGAQLHQLQLYLLAWAICTCKAHSASAKDI